jgi:Bifunctional DNA primase/polymerase, N-terminal
MTLIPVSTGRFPTSQPDWAAQRIATFPVRPESKRPAVKGYGKIGLPASAQLAHKRSFANIDGVGFMTGPRSRITVLDIDAADEQLLVQALDRHGRTPFVVRTASGKFHAYYRHDGERRRIRPWPDRPIDLLGAGGFVIAPPTLITGKGAYEIIEGSLDDLWRLPPIQNLGLDLDAPAPVMAEEPPLEPPPRKGQRNKALWRHCMWRARQCGAFNDLLNMARSFNMSFDHPLSDTEVATVARNAWKYTQQGRNYFGQRGAWSPLEEIISMDADALKLLAFLRASNGQRSEFMCTNSLHEQFGWTRARLVAARSCLIEMNYIAAVSQACNGRAAKFRWAS